MAFMWRRSVLIAAIAIDTLAATSLIAAPPSRPARRPAAVRPTCSAGSHQACGRTIGSNFGPMTVRTFDQTRFAATYNNWNGRADGEVQGDSVSGYWTQSDGGHPCATMRDGRRDWGKFTVEFTPDGRSFRGMTGYCDDAPEFPWNSK